MHEVGKSQCQYCNELPLGTTDVRNGNRPLSEWGGSMFGKLDSGRGIGMYGKHYIRFK